MKKDAKQKEIRFTFDLPLIIHAELKSRAAYKGLSLKQYVTRILVEALKKEEEYD